jgi:FMN-dependent NADH-azoreductase
MKNIPIKNLLAGSDFQLANYPSFIDLETSEAKKKKKLNDLREDLSKHQDIICMPMENMGFSSAFREWIQLERTV